MERVSGCQASGPYTLVTPSVPSTQRYSVMPMVEPMSFNIVLVLVLALIVRLLDDVALSVMAVVEAMGIDIRIFSVSFRRPLLFRHSELPSLSLVSFLI
jgi:hypothetical protein